MKCRFRLISIAEINNYIIKYVRILNSENRGKEGDWVKRDFLRVGIDVGSTTTKIVVLDDENRILLSNYQRHHANQALSVYQTLDYFEKELEGKQLKVALTGSGAKTLSERLELSYVQEVVANAVGIKQDYPQVRTAIELGGQDAKIIFFRWDETTDNLAVSDMRMNGSCAGGTGAFIDEMASILKVPVQELNQLAKKGRTVYDISGRCGVYAKTDIQPLLNQGAPKEDLALSSLHAIAKQTIGGLAQGIPIEKPVIFEGGPLTYVPELIRVFSERLNLEGDDIVVPRHPQLMVAYGAALAHDSVFKEGDEPVDYAELMERLDKVCNSSRVVVEERETRPFFANEEEYREFKSRHPGRQPEYPTYQAGDTVRAYLGIDSGSTTTKFVLIDEDERMIDSFYGPNEGDPLAVAKKALLAVRDKYRDAGVNLEIVAAGTTGYGELLFYKAFSTECHIVETVAHAKATSQYEKDATFILDIGGQDMKAIWLDHGIITNIVVNEACSSGCGSFLENFAESLHIPIRDVQSQAFHSEKPANLGSRCTVFMNSSIVTEQRNGKLPADIMAGLCRSIIENVFTKVIRVSNLESLGDKIVVQGGTFQNDAVLRAMEQYIGKNVKRAPYPGLMGAIGAAKAAKEKTKKSGFKPTFIGLDALEDFECIHESNLPCPFCGNHCQRSVVRFPNGEAWVTNNRCERGEVLGDPSDESVKRQLKERQKMSRVPNLFDYREKQLFKDYPIVEAAPEKDVTVGIPRVLSYWETMPFWTTFWRSLGYKVRLSDKSTRKMYENGLSAVTSDTVCFPAKLVHGHIRNLVAKKVDFIFMPSITTVETENRESTSVSMCAVVKGYPIVLRNSDNPGKEFGVPLEAPLFHWYTNEDRDRQLPIYMEETFGVTKEQTLKAVAAADKAQAAFHRKMKQAGAKIMKSVIEHDSYAVVLASRPYQNDELVNHKLPKMFTERGIPVLTADSVPGTEDLDLSNSRIDVVNNYHARMLSCAVEAANNPNLEYVQIVSFGCGHDAYLSDEIIRMMKEISGKTPLVLKLDESDVQGPLRIRVRSFIETLEEKRELHQKLDPHPLADPYPVKFTKEDKKEKVVLVPNTSHAFSRIMAAAFARQGVRAVPLDIGQENAIRLGKKYVHNDICFPAQIVIGEALDALESGKYDDCDVAIGMGKYIGDCRLTHYSALLRKALDDAGYSNVPIVTNDDVDSHNMHPGFQMSLTTALCVAYALPMIDELEELLRKIRPYEKVKGSADAAFEKAMDEVVYGLQEKGIPGLKKGFTNAIEIMKDIEYDRSNPRPRVLIVGEYLLNFHPGANHDIEGYLERNGMEIVEARMTDVIRKTYFYQHSQMKEYKVKKPIVQKTVTSVSDQAFEWAHDMTDKIACTHPLYERPARLPELARDSDEVIHHTFDAGEGILIPGEIIHHAKHGCKSFVILQPFGCLPNHVVGRGIAKKMKEMFPDTQILPLDYDPDVSFANVENRLQMLIMNAK